MNENKTIKINPDLFNFNKNSNKNKTSKNKPIVSSNKLKQKFLNKIKEHKNKEINDFKIKIKNNIQNDSKKENKSTILDNNDDFLRIFWRGFGCAFVESASTTAIGFV
jgi:hypothetical protein